MRWAESRSRQHDGATCEAAGDGARSRTNGPLIVRLVAGMLLVAVATSGMALRASPTASGTAPQSETAVDPAQDGSVGGGAAEGPEPMPGADDLRETIALLFMVRMKNELGLSKEQYEQILPKVDERERMKKTAFENRRATTARLRDLLARKNASDTALAEEVDRMLALDDAERRKEDAFVADLRKLLSPRQQAKFLLFRQRFRLWLDNRMREAQQMRRPGPRRRLGLGPGPRRPDREPDEPPEEE